MDTIQRNNIYDRLYAMKLEIEHQTAPNPRYISNKIIECHNFIEEVEKYSIDINREHSILQQALNNTKTDYEIKKDNLLINNEEIKNLPNIKDREARANSLLRVELGVIKDYENQIMCLNSLSKIINLKNKNLDRTNSDLKLLVRTLEAQVKLGEANAEDKVTKSLMQEFQKSLIGDDPFEDAQTRVVEEVVIDESNLDINNLLTQPEPEILKLSQEDDIDALFGPDPFKKEIEKPSSIIDTSTISLDDLFDSVSESIAQKINTIPDTSINLGLSNIQSVSEKIDPETEEEPINTCDTWVVIDSNTIEDTETKKDNTIDLSFIDFTKNKKGGEQINSSTVQTKRDEVVIKQHESHQTETGINIDDLLSNLII